MIVLIFFLRGDILRKVIVQQPSLLQSSEHLNQRFLAVLFFIRELLFEHTGINFKELGGFLKAHLILYARSGLSRNISLVLANVSIISIKFMLFFSRMYILLSFRMSTSFRTASEFPGALCLCLLRVAALEIQHVNELFCFGHKSPASSSSVFIGWLVSRFKDRM